MKITREFIMSGSTNGHAGWNREQLAVIGVSWPPINGWMSRVIGNELSDAKAKLFLGLKGEKQFSLRQRIKNELKLHPDLFGFYEDSPENYANQLYFSNQQEFLEDYR